MFERVLGSADFFKALNQYLTKNQFNNANADTLINEFVAVRNNKSLCGNLDARKIFDDFLKKEHYPVVRVWVRDNKYQFSSYSANPHSQNNWTIPLLAYNLRTRQESAGYLMEDWTVCPENFANVSDPYIFNHKSTSFVRIHYSPELWDQILKADTTKIDDSTLLGLITDAIEEEESG
jgi:aminopeptidase N